MFQSASELNRVIHDPVPKNASKYGIHQTYLTTDAERTAKGGYKFKAPEMWSSARSGKKSISIRSIQWFPKQIHLDFDIRFHRVADGNDHTNDIPTIYNSIIAPFQKTYEILADIRKTINKQLPENSKLTFNIDFEDNWLWFQATHADNDSYQISLVKDIEYEGGDSSKPIIRSPFDELFNQPFTGNDGEWHDIIMFDNVWDRFTLNFHASIIPFDNYQYLGQLSDRWDNPIIYQDPNASPLFDIWTTSDLKTPFPILHEKFVIRMTFIISSENQYHA